MPGKGSASPSLGSRTLPKPHTKKQRATAGLVASLGWGPATMPAGPACGSWTRTPRARCGASRVRRGSGAVPLLTVVRGRRRALGAAHRHAAGETRGGRTAAAGVPSSWTLPLGCSRDSHSARAASRREGLRPKIGTLQLFFYNLAMRFPPIFFFKHTPAHFRTFSSAL